MGRKGEARGELDRQARAAVSVWYGARLEYGTPNYYPTKRKPRIEDVPDDVVRAPDPLAGAKAERPFNWTTQKVRPVIDENGRTKLDAKGQPVLETIDVRDVLTADGRQSEPPQRSKPPRGDGSSLGIERARTPTAAPSTGLAFINQTMLRLGICDQQAYFALEMWGAGYSQRLMASKFGYKSKSDVRGHLDAGWGIVRFALLTQPRYIQSGSHYLPKMRAADLGLGRDFAPLLDG